MSTRASLFDGRCQLSPSGEFPAPCCRPVVTTVGVAPRMQSRRHRSEKNFRGLSATRQFQRKSCRIIVSDRTAQRSSGAACVWCRGRNRAGVDEVGRVGREAARSSTTGVEGHGNRVDGSHGTVRANARERAVHNHAAGLLVPSMGGDRRGMRPALGPIALAMIGIRRRIGRSRASVPDCCAVRMQAR